MTGDEPDFRNADLPYRLRSLGMACAVLHLGAHPDDEDAGLMAYLSRGQGVRTVYWSATRGEGGQNRTGPERAEALGILRTWESLDARALDGGEVLYGPFYDFGFSRSGQDALARWDREAVVREIVRAIRLAQPHVVVSRWRGEAEDGHGHHQAIGMAVEDAFVASADEARFPELVDQGLPAWGAQKLYRSAVGDWQPGEDVAFGRRRPDLDAEHVLRINTGAVDPVSGRSYQELAWIGVNRHQSQAMSVLPTRGDHLSYYRLDRSSGRAEAPERGFFDGLDPTLPGLADHPGNGSSSLRTALARLRDQVTAAADAYRPHHPGDAGRMVLDALTSLRKLLASLGDHGLADDARRALDRYLRGKVGEFEEAAARCLGLDVECLVNESRVNPGHTVMVQTAVWNRGDGPVDAADVHLDVPGGWTVRALDAPPAQPDVEETPILTAAFEVAVPATAALSAPYWLREPRTAYRYTWPDRGPLAMPLDEPLISATCELGVGTHRVSITKPAVHRDTFVGGHRELPLEVVPPVSLRPRERRRLLPVTERTTRIELQLAAQSMRDDVAGTVGLNAPTGWDVQPAEVDLSFARAGETRMLRFEVTVPADAKPGIHELRYRMTSGHRDYGVVLQPVWRRAPGVAGVTDQSNCVAEALIMGPATVSLHLIEARFVQRLRYAYIRGAEEEIITALEPFDLNVAILAPEELSYADLGMFDVIVVGPNAYLMREEVRRNAARLLEYVERGGTLIVQYQGYGYERQGLAPYPFRHRQPHDRITSPDAPVTILEPGHPVFGVPNQITEEDFDGWVHDRGLYFFGEWDRRYLPLLESADPGQDPQRGGLLVASYGRGTYVYSGYSFFRQIPEGVPGAIRLFANLLGLAEARILERVERVRHIPLFSSMTDPQLYEVSRLMAERWVDEGTYLCRQGERGSELYLVLDGEVEVLKGDGSEKVVYVAGAGEVVGELAVLTDLPRSATLRTKGEATILLMRGSHFRDFLRQHPHLLERVTAILAERLASSEVMW